ncbi:MAG: hypothetical protein M9934_01005 [Thermomicrobiales bacterium]|nr:hypothetical protein [Thermomicrobiales bacterium]
MLEQRQFENTSARPDAHGYFGRFGGVFAPETLMPAINEHDRVRGSEERS